MPVDASGRTIGLLLLVTVVLTYLGSATYLDAHRRVRMAVAHGAPTTSTDPLLVRLRSSVDRWGRRTRPGLAVSRRLRRAGLQLRVSDALLYAGAVVVIAGALGYLALGRVAALVVAVAAGRALLSVLDWLTNRRREQFVAQLPQLARLLSNGAAAGLSLRRSITAAASELGEPARTELRYVADALALGVPVERAVLQLDERLPSRELSVLVKTLVIQVRSGGGLVTALQRMSQTLDARKKLRQEMRSALSGTVYVSYLLPVIGLLGVVVVTGGRREVIARYFTEGLGQVALVVALVLGGTGMLIIRRSVRQALE